MASIRRGAALRQIQSLYEAGTSSGLTDCQLLERYMASRGERAEAAFSALIERHGPMVLRVCRAVLRDEHDAEDAFQATFLVLARRAGSIRHKGSLASWLFGVAGRVAQCARSGAARRRWHERRAAGMRTESVADVAPDDLGAAIQREVGRLPDRLRAAVVLCYLEGKTCEQAAGQLHLPVGTIKSRLSGARSRLRSRLARAGHAPDAANPAAWLLASPLIVPSRLTIATIASVMASAAGRSASAGIISTSAATLTEGVLRAMSLSGLKAGTVLTLAIVALAWMSTQLGAGGPGQPVAKVTSSRTYAFATPANGERSPARPGETVLARGRVVDRAGRPVPGASVRLLVLGGWSLGPDLRTTSGPDGRFVLSVPVGASDRIAEAAQGTPRVVATAPGFGLGWADPADHEELTVRLVADLPIEGRIVDAQGRPIAGVRIRTHNAWASPKEDLSSFIEDVKSRGSSPWAGPRPLALISYDATATTDADGRFRLEGIGRERVAALTLAGPTIVTEDVYAMTRTGPAIRPVGWERLEPGARTYRGARFEHAAAPTRPIIGTVRDVETGLPIAGAKIRGDVEAAGGHAGHPGAVTTTDDQGRYTLTGLPPEGKYRLLASSTRGLSYVGRGVSVTAFGVAGTPARCDITLRQGVLIRGRVSDEATGFPVRAGVTYYPFPGNPHLEHDPAIEPHVVAGDEGRFEIAVPPGRGVLVAHAGNGRYLAAIGADQIEGLDRIPSLSRRPPNVVPDYHAVVEVSPAAGSGPVTRDLQLLPVRSVKGTVVDLDGRPVGDLVAMGLDANVSWSDRVLGSADFTVDDIDPREPRRIFFFQVDRRLAGSAWIKGDEAGPLSIRLQPWGTVTGRVIDDQGRPQSGLVLTGSYPTASDRDSGILPRRVTVGEDGRFRFEGLVPGLQYHASVLEMGGYGERRAFRGLRVGPGETRELGDIKLERHDRQNTPAAPRGSGEKAAVP